MHIPISGEWILSISFSSISEGHVIPPAPNVNLSYSPTFPLLHVYFKYIFYPINCDIRSHEFSSVDKDITYIIAGVEVRVGHSTYSHLR
jgi:hypothetical protein